jgi:4-hydroxybutyrate dehydrogenase
VLRFKEGHVGDKYERLRTALRLETDAKLDGVVEALNKRIGMPPGLKAMGLREDLIPMMAGHALADHSTATNPRPVTEEDFQALIREAWEGRG